MMTRQRQLRDESLLMEHEQGLSRPSLPSSALRASPVPLSAAGRLQTVGRVIVGLQCQGVGRGIQAIRFDR